MCGRFTLRTPTPVLVTTFRVNTFPELGPRFNIAPTQQVAVVRNRDAERQAVAMHWGLVPSWAKDPKIGNRMMNARSETAASKPSFRAAFQRRRCLVVADGYYEWKRIGKQKQPFLVRLHDDRPFAMAGLWESWQGNENGSSAEPMLSCTILTTDSNELTSDLHDRMPVILAEANWNAWLEPIGDSSDPLQSLMVAHPSDEMKMDPVSTYVNNSRNEGPGCVELESDLFS